MNADWAVGSTWADGGTLNIIDTAATTEDAWGMQIAFQNLFGEGTSILFSGEVNQPLSSSVSESESAEIGSSETINEILQEASGALLPEVVYKSETENLVIGDSNGLADSVGLKKIENVSSVTVLAGKSVTLLGDGTSATSAAINISAGASLELGSSAPEVTAVQGGTIGTITAESGSINVRKGSFTAESVAGLSSLLIETAGELISSAAVAVKNAKISGKLASATAVTASDKVVVAAGGSLKASLLKAANNVENAGLLQAGDVQSRELVIKESGTLIVSKFGDKLNQTVLNSGVVLATTASNLGMVQLQSGSSLIVGAGNIEAYYLMHLDLAKQIYENGGTLSQAVIDSLVSKGMIVSPASLSVEGETLPNEASTADDDIAPPEVNTAAETASPTAAIARNVPADVRNIIRTGGTLYEAVRLSQEAHGTVLDHVLTAAPESGALWVKGVYARTDTDAFESDTTGFAFGADGPVGSARIGAAFTAQRGDLDAAAGENDINAYSFSVYGAKPIAWGMNLAAGLTYIHTDNELSFAGWEGKAKTDSVLFGARLTKPLDLGSAFTLTPYVGADVGFIRARDFDIRTASADSFAVKKESEWFGRIPVGLKAEKRFALSDGFLKMGADASVTTQIGAKSVDHRIQNSEYRESLSDRYLGSLDFSIEYERGNASFTLDYGMTIGDERNVSHSISVRAQLIF